MSQEESKYFKKNPKNANKERHQDAENGENHQRTYEPVVKPVRLKAMLQNHQDKMKQRAFGRELQPHQQPLLDLSTTANGKRPNFYNKPNPNERLWNPSPSKRPRSREYDSKTVKGTVSSVQFEEENARAGWRDNEDDEKENLTSIYFQKPAVIPYSDKDPPTDLNNSFTEKISNLDIGGILNTVTEEPTQQLLNSPPQVTELPSNQVHQVNCVETLNQDYPYITEILNHWHSLELLNKASPNYMGKQKEISHKMRTILIDWIVEVVEEYRIGDATLHRCVHFVDRFLSKLQISRSNLQLLGTTALFIACKIEEIQPPDTSDLVYITDNTYDKTQLMKMECLILSVLDFDLLTPTAYEFTEYFSTTLTLTQTAKEFSHYIIELTLLDGERYLKFQGSVISMAACYVSIRCCGDTHTTSSNKLKQGSLQEVLSRVKRLTPTREFHNKVEEAVSNIYFTLLSTGNSQNSVCTKYRQFQESRYLVSIASLSATTPLPWF